MAARDHRQRTLPIFGPVGRWTLTDKRTLNDISKHISVDSRWYYLPSEPLGCAPIVFSTWALFKSCIYLLIYGIDLRRTWQTTAATSDRKPICSTVRHWTYCTSCLIPLTTGIYWCWNSSSPRRSALCVSLSDVKFERLVGNLLRFSSLRMTTENWLNAAEMSFSWPRPIVTTKLSFSADVPHMPFNHDAVCINWHVLQFSSYRQ